MKRKNRRRNEYRRVKSNLPRIEQRYEKWVKFPVDDGWKYGYSVSNFGRVRKNGATYKKHKILNIDWETNQEHRVRINVSREGTRSKRLSFSVPNLVREYHTKIPKGEVVYKDGNSGNFKANNMKRRDPRRRLRDKDVKYIKYMVATGQDSITQLAKQFKVTRGALQRIIRGETYKEVTVHVDDFS